MATVKQITPRTKRRVHVRFIFFCALLLIVLVLALALAMGWISFSSNDVTESTSIVLSSNAPYVYTGNGFFYMKNNQLIYGYASDPQKGWIIENVDAANIRLAASPGICVIYNRNSMQCFNTLDGSAAFNREFVGDILNICCGNTYIAVLKRDPDATLVLYIFDFAGAEKDSIPLSEQYVIDFGFYGASDMLWTLSLNTKAVTPVCVLTTYGAGSKALTGIMPLDSQIIERPLFTDTNVFLISTHYIYAYNAQNKEVYPPKLIYGWALMDSSLSGSKPMLLFKPRQDIDSQEINSVQLLTIPDETLMFSPPKGVLSVFLSQGRILCVTPTELLTYTAKGEIKSSYPFAAPVDGAVKLDDNHILLQRGDKLFFTTVR